MPFAGRRTERDSRISATEAGEPSRWCHCPGDQAAKPRSGARWNIAVESFLGPAESLDPFDLADPLGSAERCDEVMEVGQVVDLYVNVEGVKAAVAMG